MAAIGTFAADNKKRLVQRGAAWGLGHTVMLFAMAIAVVLFSVVLSTAGEAVLEFAVGMMLLLLGLQVFWRMRQKRIHFHVHRHADNAPHFHAHSHANETVKHSASAHEHKHAKGFPLKAFAIGLVHGAAGSSAIIVLAAAATGNAWAAIGYVALVGVGSIVGMATLSAIVSLPFDYAPKKAKRLHLALQLAVGGLAVTIGIAIMADTGALAMGAF